MNPTPPPQAPHQAVKKKRGWILPTIIVSVVVLALCCVGGVAIVALSGDNGDDNADLAAGPDPANDDRPAATPETEPDADADAEPDGFGGGIWEVGTEIPPGTYVTVVSGGGVFDSCYWARLSGFSGSFDDIIANDNLSAGARGRLEISSSDIGVEFSGGCTWIDASEAAPVAAGHEVGEGVWAVGDEIAPGTYTTDATDGDVFDSCYWARLSGFSGEFGEIIANDIVEAGARGRVEISASDAGVEFSGDCVWTRS
jgi:hypothetical protein